MNLEQLHSEVLKACVRVRTKRAGGSGTVIYSQGEPGQVSTYVLTNQHVIDDAVRVVEKWDPVLQKNVKRDERDLVEVHFFNYRWSSRVVGANAIEAEIVAYDKDEDLALLKLRGTDPVPAVAKLFPRGEESRLLVGEPIITVGCGLGEPPVLTQGVISVFGREIDSKEYWLCTAPSIYGSSGGGTFLVETREFIGVPSRVAVTGFLGSSAVTHLSYSIPITRVYDFLEKQMFRFIYDAGFTEDGEAETRKRLLEADKLHRKENPEEDK
jgi:S1-C subfamily serine protease